MPPTRQYRAAAEASGESTSQATAIIAPCATWTLGSVPDADAATSPVSQALVNADVMLKRRAKKGNRKRESGIARPKLRLEEEKAH